jgi:hypothetical protein
MRFAQIRDRVDTGLKGPGPIDLSGLQGTWVNSNPDTNGIARMVMSQSNGDLMLQVFAIGPDGLIDWGVVPVTVLASGPSSRAAAGFCCRYDFGFVETRLQAMILKGLIVLAELHRFKDDSKRVDYFVREYFSLEHGRY